MGLGVDELENMTAEELQAYLSAGGPDAMAAIETPPITAVQVDDMGDMSIEELQGIADYENTVPTEIDAGDGASDLDKFRGSRSMRTLAGAAFPVTGPFQLGANIGDAAYGGIVNAGQATGLIDDDFQRSSLSDDVNEGFKQYRASANRGQKALGEGDFDLLGLGGEMAVAGAGTAGMQGYKHLMKAGAAIGAGTPTDNESFWSTKGMQTLAGGVGGLLGQGLADGVGYVGGRLAPVFSEASDIAGKAIREAVGDKASEVIKALRGDISPFSQGSAAEVASDVGSTKFSALQAAVDDIASDEAWARQMAQNTEKVEALESIAAVVEPGKAAREQVTTPMRETTLNAAEQNTAKIQGLEKAKAARAAVGGTDEATNIASVPNAVRYRAKLEGEQGLAKTRSKNRTTVFGARIPEQYTPDQDLLAELPDAIADAKLVEDAAKAGRDMVDYQLEAMGAYGIKPATVSPILAGVDELLKQPKIVGNPEVGKVLSAARKAIAKMADENGVINPAALYEYRKTGLNLTIEKFTRNADASTKRTMVAGLSDLKTSLDDVIDSAAGGGWRQYLKAYQEMSLPVEQGEIGMTLAGAFRGVVDPADVNPGAFASAVDDAETTLRKSGVGGGARELGDVLNETQMGIVSAIRADLTRAAKTRSQASAGSRSKNEAFAHPGDVTMVNPLMREIMVTNAVLRSLSKGKQAETEKVIVELFQRDPDLAFTALADALEAADTAAARSVILKKFNAALPAVFTAASATTTAQAIQ